MASRVILGRPGKRNVLSSQLIADFLDCLAGASKNPAVKVIVVTGKVTFFSAGSDLNDIATIDSAGARSCRYLEDLCHGMAAVRKPLVAAVNGPALGGGFELALMRGLIPGAGGTQRLTAAVGKYRAMRTILLGRPITADEALSWGLLCDQVADSHHELMGRTMGIATELMGRGQEALQLAKEAIGRADSLCRDDAYEKNLYYVTFGTKEKRKGFLTRPTRSSGSDVKTATCICSVDGAGVPFWSLL